MKKIILASGSPRRRELLQMLNIPFEIRVSDVEEIVPAEHDTTPADRVKYLSLIKSRAVAAEAENYSIIIGSDTVVAKDNDILNKPKDAEDAKNMLRRLSGCSHHVYTGLTVIVKNEDGSVKETSYADCTEVVMNEISDKEIENYISSGECMDKAGAYAIQGKSSIFIDSIKGDYYTVVGLPVRLVFKALKDNGINVTDFFIP